MTFGLQAWDANNRIALDTSKSTWMQVDFFVAPRNTQTERSYAQLADAVDVKVAQVMIDPPLTDRKAIAHFITVVDNGNGKIVTVSGGSEDSYILVLMK